MNETLKVRGTVVCGVCAESIFAREKKIPADQVEQQLDPTICVGCGMDNAAAELPKLGQLPVCSKCEVFFKNRPFPGWVKAALAGMVILVVFALVWNGRFIRAYYDLRCFASAAAMGDFERGAAHIISAAQRVPENAELQAMGACHEGMLLLDQGEAARALELLRSCRGRVPAEWPVEDLIMQAEYSVAFDEGDYDEFLRLALQMEQKYKDEPTYAGVVASAYACKYAETADEQYKAKSLAALGRARDAASSNPEYKQDFAEYEQRILHRLHTRAIIDGEEFHRRYPNGWTKAAEEKP